MKEGGTEQAPTYTEMEFDFNSPIVNNYSLYAKYSGEAIMMARKGNTAFWQERYRSNITNIIFCKNSALIPTSSDIIESWNVEADENCASIVAYLIDDGTGNSTYKLIIYSENTIYSNMNSYNYFYNFTKLSSITLY